MNNVQVSCISRWLGDCSKCFSTSSLTPCLTVSSWWTMNRERKGMGLDLHSVSAPHGKEWPLHYNPTQWWLWSQCWKTIYPVDRTSSCISNCYFVWKEMACCMWLIYMTQEQHLTGWPLGQGVKRNTKFEDWWRGIPKELCEVVRV